MTFQEWPALLKQNTDTIKWPFTVQAPRDLYEMSQKVSKYGHNGYVGKVCIIKPHCSRSKHQQDYVTDL